MRKVDDTDVYWQEFYSNNSPKKPPLLPSQFAAFVSNDISRNAFVVDVGCGNGRDALYFGRHGFSVVGIDRSENAIAVCSANAPKSCSFQCHDLQTLELEKYIPPSFDPERDSLVIYSRFFLHAINRDLQSVFIQKIASIGHLKPTVYLEFRSDRDADRLKVTPEHYRRYVDLPEFESDAAKFGLEFSYKVVGTGFAKYLDDDAYVARYILNCR